MAEESGRKVNLVTISKGLSKILRHQAINMGLHMTSDGFVPLAEVLSLRQFNDVSLSVIEQVVNDNNKKRFELVLIDEASSPLDRPHVASDYMIRAVQGHTINTVEDALLLDEINLDNLSQLLPNGIAYHGTYRRFLPSILQSGLQRMSRNHIHMAVALPGADGLISGMRHSSEVVVVVDVKQALERGIVFALSRNGVVLSRGLEDSGSIPSEFFRDVIALDGKPLDIEEEKGKRVILPKEFRTNSHRPHPQPRKKSKNDQHAQPHH